MTEIVSHIKLKDVLLEGFAAAVRKQMPSQLSDLINAQSVNLSWVQNEMMRVASLVNLEAVRGPAIVTPQMLSPARRFFMDREILGTLDIHTYCPLPSVLMLMNVTNPTFPPSWLDIDGQRESIYSGDTVFINNTTPYKFEPLKEGNAVQLLLTKIFFFELEKDKP